MNYKNNKVMNALNIQYRRSNSDNAAVKDVNRTSYRTKFEMYSQDFKITTVLYF